MRRADKELNKKAAESVAAGMKLAPEELSKVLEDENSEDKAAYNAVDLRLTIEQLQRILIQIYDSGRYNSHTQKLLIRARKLTEKIQSLTGV